MLAGTLIWDLGLDRPTRKDKITGGAMVNLGQLGLWRFPMDRLFDQLIASI